jgi:hypothetical protein
VISFITGKPGGGKGLLTQQQHVDELQKGTRCIITSLPVRVEPWVNGRFEPMIGLRQFLHKKFGKDFDVGTRVFLLDDEQAAEFFLWRVIDGKLVKAEAEYKTSKEGERRIMGYDTSLAAKSGPTMYSIDEAWKHWGSRNWQKTGEGMLFYGAQHRHFGDDVLIVTQHTKQIDPAIQRVAQDFWVVRNHGKMTFGMFRQPAVFSVCIYDQPPTGASIDPMSRKVFTLDKAGLAQTYDTSAGIGLSGRMMADVGARGKGLPPWLMVVAVFGLLALAWFVVTHGARMMTHAFTKAGNPAAKVVQDAVLKPGKVAAADTFLKPVLVPGEKSVDVVTNEVFCVGHILLSHGTILVMLSDGRVADSRDGEVQKVYKRAVVVFGNRYEVRFREPEYQPARMTESSSGVGVDERPPILDSHVVPGKRMTKVEFR